MFPAFFGAGELLSFSLSVIFLYFLIAGFVVLRIRPLSKYAVLITLVSMYGLLGFYHYKSTQFFDFAILADHGLSVLRKGSFFESWTVVKSIFGPADYLRTAIAMIGMYFCVRRDLQSYTGPIRFALPVAVISLSGILFFVASPSDELSSLSKSALYRALRLETTFQSRYKPRGPASFSLIRKMIPQHGSGDRPNVFFIFVESVNARFIEAKAPNGKEYTPFLNSLIPQAMYFERFYAQSIQTGRGHFASLCSLTPSIYGKEFENFVDRRLNCLPEILQKNGYFTIFSKANEDINFDNTYSFTTSHGFKEMNTMSKGCTGEDKDVCWGWGLPDNIFYQRFFKHLSQTHKQGPVFASLATISSHMPFNEVPPAERYIYKNPQSRLEHYSNALRVSDEYLKTFFAELKQSPYSKNSIVFVMGDHSFPMGEHSNFQNEIFAFEENFRTPLLVLDFRENKKVPASRVTSAYSQIHLAPTVLDLAGISAKTAFQGDSLLSAPPEYVHMVQPYGGVYFTVIKYPYKYMLYDRSQKEYLYDLQSDPQEMTNLLDSWTDVNLLEKFRHEVGKVWSNYDALSQNKIWPKEALFFDDP
ncbi:MAG: sulfatase-like hydrolase/transferase [Bdellovibrio sp.]|nr:sulfatase-like hydrolase/transferase [Bdellovibrio sp.]